VEGVGEMVMFCVGSGLRFQMAILMVVVGG
jgi:hypothetical protein